MDQQIIDLVKSGIQHIQQVLCRPTTATNYGILAQQEKDIRGIIMAVRRIDQQAAILDALRDACDELNFALDCLEEQDRQQAQTCVQQCLQKFQEIDRQTSSSR